ncbi:MAG: hypothetical protein J4472_02495 [DPANN group archaeon]|nr:hypothetical protein [DPANN group archaeon]MBS3078797.1 hypothetical protein [Candidatus Pacearchaeota archaeon]
MIDYAAACIAEFFQGVLKVYDFFNPKYARTRRMAEFEALKASGELENMCSSEVYTYFGITREFPDGESV